MGVVSAPAETSQVQELDELRTESPVRQQVAEATNQISDDVLVQQEAFVQEDAQTVTNQITAVAGTVEVQSTAPLLIAEDERVCEPVYPGLDSLIAGKITHSFIHSLTHSYTHISPVHLITITHLITHSQHSITCSLTHLITHSSTHPLIQSLIYSPTPAYLQHQWSPSSSYLTQKRTWLCSALILNLLQTTNL